MSNSINGEVEVVLTDLVVFAANKSVELEGAILGRGTMHTWLLVLLIGKGWKGIRNLPPLEIVPATKMKGGGLISRRTQQPTILMRLGNAHDRIRREMVARDAHSWDYSPIFSYV